MQTRDGGEAGYGTDGLGALLELWLQVGHGNSCLRWCSRRRGRARRADLDSAGATTSRENRLRSPTTHTNAIACIARYTYALRYAPSPTDQSCAAARLVAGTRTARRCPRAPPRSTAPRSHTAGTSPGSSGTAHNRRGGTSTGRAAPRSRAPRVTSRCSPGGGVVLLELCWLARRLLKHKRHGLISISQFAAPSRLVRMGGYRGAEPTIQSRPALPLCTGLTLVPIPLPQVRDSTLGSSRFCLLALVSTPARYGNVKSHAVYKAALFQLGRLVEGLA